MTGRFRDRPTRSVGIASINGWRLKRYEITLDGRRITDDINDAFVRHILDPSAGPDIEGYLVDTLTIQPPPG